jgi:hypothetical protein
VVKKRVGKFIKLIYQYNPITKAFLSYRAWGTWKRVYIYTFIIKAVYFK